MSTDDTQIAPPKRKPTAPCELVDGVKHYRLGFTPKAKHPCIELRLHLRTETAFRVFQNVYDPLQNALYHLYAVLPVACREDRTVLDAVHAEIEKNLVEIEKEVSDELERNRITLKNDGADQISKYYNDEVFFAESVTPQMSRFLGLLRTLDEAMVTVDAMWMSGGIPEQHKTQHLMKWRNRVTRLNRTISTLHVRVIGDAGRQARLAQIAQKGAAEPPKAKKGPPEKNVVSGKKKQKQQRRAGKVTVLVPEQATSAAPVAQSEPDSPTPLAAPVPAPKSSAAKAVSPTGELADAAA